MSLQDAYADLSTAFSNITTLLAPTVTDLYKGVDTSGLNAYEFAWMSWYQMFKSPVIATGVMSFLLHEAVYFGRCVPFMIIDQMSYFRQWKLQPTKVPTAAQQWKCTKAVLWLHFTIELPQARAFPLAPRSVGMATWEVPFPALKTIAFQVLLFALLEDTWHYWAHRLFHYKGFYKYIHKVHHEYSAPFGLAAEYAHPLEVVSLGAGTVLAPLVYCWYTGGKMHILTMYIWIVLRLLQAVDSHSGYQFPWSLNNFFIGWAGADHHDYHHQAYLDCYASSFRHWDYFLGTDKRYHAFRAKQYEAKAAEKSGGAKGCPGGGKGATGTCSRAKTS